MTASHAVSVGVLSLHNGKEAKAILNAVEDLGHDPEWLRHENTTLCIEDRSHMSYSVILGRDILGDYQVDMSRQADRESDSEVDSEE